MVKISLEGLDDQHDFMLVGGPFDGSSIKMATDLVETLPHRIILECCPSNSRGGPKEHYVLSQAEDDVVYRYEGD